MERTTSVFLPTWLDRSFMSIKKGKAALAVAEEESAERTSSIPEDSEPTWLQQASERLSRPGAALGRASLAGNNAASFDSPAEDPEEPDWLMDAATMLADSRRDEASAHLDALPSDSSDEYEYQAATGDTTGTGNGVSGFMLAGVPRADTTVTVPTSSRGTAYEAQYAMILGLEAKIGFPHDAWV